MTRLVQEDNSEQSHSPEISLKHRTFFRWTFTLLILTAVFIAAMHFSEEEDFAKILEEANPVWILAGLLLQLGTYYSQAYIWKLGLELTGNHFKINQLASLSVAQLFINQVVPSASLSGAIFISKALSQRNVPKQDVSVIIGLSLITYFEAYALAAGVAVIQFGVLGHLGMRTVLYIEMLIFIAGLGLLILMFKINLRPLKIFLKNTTLQRFSTVKKILKLVEETNLKRLRLVLILKGTGLQLLVFVFDFLTLWTMIKAIGSNVNLGTVFTSYMAAYLARTIGVLPGGVGFFEAASILSLHKAGMTVAGSLSATLLYRGLSYWLPMLPGLFLVRRELLKNKNAN